MLKNDLGVCHIIVAEIKQSQQASPTIHIGWAIFNNLKERNVSGSELVSCTFSSSLIKKVNKVVFAI